MIPTIYTWTDIESILNSNSAFWPENWKAIETYANELVIFTDNANETRESEEFLSNTFGTHYDAGKGIIKLFSNELAVIFELANNKEYQLSEKSPLPLFESAIFERGDAAFKVEALPVPIVVFHSYKGGVGRTLSALAFVRELSKRKENTLKALLVDADIEAPGLTWMESNDNDSMPPKISYLDILSIIHDCPVLEDDTKKSLNVIAHKVADVISRMTIQIPTDEIIVDHYFLPVYRVKEQLLGKYANPSDIISMPGRSFIISDFLAMVGKALNVDVIVVDLRAGISNLSAPFLFDPRTRKVFVTSTSYQSTIGTALLVESIMNSSFYPRNNNENSLSPTVLLTMVPPGFDAMSLREIKEKLLAVFPSNDSLEYVDDIENAVDKEMSDALINSKFSERLLHLEDIPQICGAIRGSDFEDAISTLIKRILPDSDMPSLNHGTQAEGSSNRIDMLGKIYAFTKNALTAEGATSIQDMLITSSLHNLGSDYRSSLPKLVVIGQKGSGKTYVYKQLLGSMYWDAFTASVLNEPGINKNRIIIAPLLATKNRTAIQSLLDACHKEIQDVLGYELRHDILNSNEMQIVQSSVITSKDWSRIAAESYCSSADNASLTELDIYLGKMGRQMVFLIDGLDDIFNDIIDTAESRSSLKYLCCSKDFRLIFSISARSNSIACSKFLILSSRLQAGYPS